MPHPRIPGPKQVVSRELASRRQIEMAIHLFRAGDYACAITLALAAESHLPDDVPDGRPYMWTTIREKVGDDSDVMKRFNRVRNWLKHHNEGDPEAISIFEFEVVFALMRATSKFTATYRPTPPTIEAFIDWTREVGFLGQPKPVS